MLMLLEFPYKIKPSKIVGPIFTPYVMLEVKNRNGVFEWHEVLFDTGADFTSFPKYMSEIVGINLENCSQDVMYTANNEPMIAYHSKVEVRLGKEEFELSCVFTDKDDTPFLLGRVGFIDKFEMLLSAKKKRLSFEKINS